MMINKRLIGTVPESKRYVAGNVILQWCSLLANIAMMTAITRLLAALYLNAMRAGKKALAICTVSDHIITGEETTAEERQTSFREMMELALEVAVRS